MYGITKGFIEIVMGESDLSTLADQENHERWLFINVNGYFCYNI